ENIEKYFTNDTLKEQYLSWENSKVKFFSLNNLPKIKKKQQDLINEIKDFLKSKNLHH
ncbi:MAG: NUDIX hydrolase, partial [Aliarcobacter butzleri]